MALTGMDELMESVQEKQGFYEPEKDVDLHKNDDIGLLDWPLRMRTIESVF